MFDLSGTTSWHLSNGLYPTAKKICHIIFLYTCTHWFHWKSDPRTNKMVLSKVKGNIMDLVGKCCLAICFIDDSLSKRLSIRIYWKLDFTSKESMMQNYPSLLFDSSYTTDNRTSIKEVQTLSYDFDPGISWGNAMFWMLLLSTVILSFFLVCSS